MYFSVDVQTTVRFTEEFGIRIHHLEIKNWV